MHHLIAKLPTNFHVLSTNGKCTRMVFSLGNLLILRLKE